jgi:hypothetical protein
MDAPTSVALVLGGGSLLFSTSTYIRNRIDVRQREERDEQREDAARQGEREHAVADRWLRERQAAYADALASLYAWFDALSEMARHVPADGEPVELDRAATDEAFVRVMEAQGVLDLIGPEEIRDAVAAAITGCSEFGWGVLDRNRAALVRARPPALESIREMARRMREDLGIDPAAAPHGASGGPPDYPKGGE